MNQKDLYKLLQATQFDATADPPKEQVVFRIQFKTIGSLGDFILFSGRPKSGKTKYLSGCMAAAISRSTVFDMQIRLPEEKRKVVHFDTEQGKYSHWKMMQLILQLANLQQWPDNFKSYRCRSVAPAQILALVECALQHDPNIGIVYLDGLLDTIESMNDEKHSSHIKRWLKRITEDYNVLLAGVIHRGFSNDKSIGQIGSEGERAAQTVLLIEKNKDTRQYIMRAEYMRDDDEFAPVAIWYNKQLSLWEQTDYIDDGQEKTPGSLKRKPHEYDISEHSANTVRIFNSGKLQNYKQLCSRICEVYGVGGQFAKEVVKILEKENLIWRLEDGNFTNIRQAKLGIAN